MFSPATTGCFRVDTGYSPADQRTVAVRTLTIEQPPSGTPPVCRPDTRRSRAKPISCGPTSPPSSAASRSSWSRWPGCRRGSSCGARSSLGCGGFGDHHCLGFGLLLDRGVSPRLAVKKTGQSPRCRRRSSLVDSGPPPGHVRTARLRRKRSLAAPVTKSGLYGRYRARFIQIRGLAVR